MLIPSLVSHRQSAREEEEQHCQDPEGNDQNQNQGSGAVTKPPHNSLHVQQKKIDENDLENFLTWFLDTEECLGCNSRQSGQAKPTKPELF